MIGFAVIFSATALGFSPIISNIAGYLAGLSLSFIFAKRFIFRSKRYCVSESIRYCIAFIISFLFNLLALQLALMYFRFHALVAQLFATAAYTFFMYILIRLFVFKVKQVR
jgi:putative flippase GtrA